MSLSLMPQRPPFVQFEQRAVEDRNASIEAGGIIMRDEDWVIVMQPGSRDTVEKIAAEWFTDIERLVHNGVYPAEWLEHFRQKFKAYKAGQEEPEMGMPVKQWPSVTAAQARNLANAGIRTVEDVAAMNEPTMQKVGMGARELKQKAQAYLETRDANKAAEEITALKAKLSDRDDRIQSLEERLRALEAAAQIVSAQSKKRA